MDKEEASHIISLSQNKKSMPTFIESDLTESEGLVYTQARERDSRPIDFLADFFSSSPWTPSSYSSKIVILSGQKRTTRFLHFSLINLPPPTLS
ncbi:hypothetical protein EHQ64_07310 [Leptospira sarikeiensis]|uniref:Uncharacterized protein n=1 Tax=Leptospira sarikeiensis TaxID=2484943 RepID=A0A4R9KB80_9LEPT|nr:hypothetical protein EHQ64_07310 [Leptospira sarikeiensis]